MLYSDCFNGFLDGTVKRGCSADYASAAEKLLVERPLMIRSPLS